MSNLPAKNKLTLSQRRAAEILANNDLHGMSLQEIADEVGVTTRTIYRWKSDPAFIEYQNSVADQVMEDFLTEAYTKLRHLLRSGKSEKTQLEALKLVLQNRGKLKESHEHNVSVRQEETLDDLRKEIIDMEYEVLDD